MPLRIAVVLLSLVLAGPTLPRAAAAAHPASSATVPVDGRVIRLFDPPSTPYGAGHRGVDLAAAPSAPVRAALPGRVAFAGAVAGRGWVTVDHGGGLQTTYGWLDPRAVAVGQRVRAGQVLGRLDGEATHLDWGARLHGAYVDPLALLGRWRARLVPTASRDPARPTGLEQSRPSSGGGGIDVQTRGVAGRNAGLWYGPLSAEVLASGAHSARRAAPLSGRSEVGMAGDPSQRRRLSRSGVERGGAGLLVTDARLATPRGARRGWLLASGGVIAAMGAGPPDERRFPSAVGGRGRVDPEVVEADGAWLLPGFIDVHVHGAVGHEAMDGDVDGLAAMAEFYARHGVTSFLATTWTGSTDDTLHALHGIARGMRELDGGARLLGAHMEGPYLSPRRCGAQDADLIRPADLDEAARFLDTGVVRLLTLAPEVAGNLALIEECARRGVAVSAGHTDATYEQIAAAVDLGVRHMTHTFNAMRPLHHREPGAVGAALTLPALSVELIADGVHVHPVVMAALLAARGADGVVLVSDAMRATGMPPGEYPIGDRTVIVADGAVRLPDGALAGSVLTLDAALRTLQQASGRPLDELWPTASRNPARVAGVSGRKGVLAPGGDADLVLVDDELAVQLTVVEGRVVHRRTPGTSRTSAGAPAASGRPVASELR